MAVGPQPIFTDNPGSLPASYTVPPGVTIDLASVYAKLNGSGAAASFLPCLTVLSQDGHVIARVKQDDIYASGDTGDATWSPFLRGNPPLGRVLQAYAGTSTAGNFTHPGPANTWKSTGFPANPTFTKISSTSALDIRLEGDFNTGGIAVDALGMGLYIDGVQQQASFVHTSLAGVIITAVISKAMGLGGSLLAPLAAGAHTLDVQIWTLNGSGPTYLCSNACDLGILEFEL